MLTTDIVVILYNNNLLIWGITNIMLNALVLGLDVVAPCLDFVVLLLGLDVVVVVLDVVPLVLLFSLAPVPVQCHFPHGQGAAQPVQLK